MNIYKFADALIGMFTKGLGSL